MELQNLTINRMMLESMKYCFNKCYAFESLEGYKNCYNTCQSMQQTKFAVSEQFLEQINEIIEGEFHKVYLRNLKKQISPPEAQGMNYLSAKYDLPDYYYKSNKETEDVKGNSSVGTVFSTNK